MEQRYEGSPRATVRLEGRRAVRDELTNDWGLRLQWEVRKNGQVVATPSARAERAYEHPDTGPGTYEIVLQMWHYVNYAKRPDGEFVNSRFLDVSDKLRYTI